MCSRQLGGHGVSFARSAGATVRLSLAPCVDVLGPLYSPDSSERIGSCRSPGNALGRLSGFRRHAAQGMWDAPLPCSLSESPYLRARDIRLLLSDPAEALRTAPLCVAARGFSLHAATTVAAHDREGLERLCRYVNRPPLAYGRLQQLDAERLAFALKTPWDNGTTHVVLSPLELIEKLAALVPPPRVHLIRYHGVLAPHAAAPARPPPQPELEFAA